MPRWSEMAEACWVEREFGCFRGVLDILGDRSLIGLYILYYLVLIRKGNSTISQGYRATFLRSVRLRSQWSVQCLRGRCTEQIMASPSNPSTTWTQPGQPQKSAEPKECVADPLLMIGLRWMECRGYRHLFTSNGRFCHVMFCSSSHPGPIQRSCFGSRTNQ